jgi:hypothetical protein
MVSDLWRPNTKIWDTEKNYNSLWSTIYRDLETLVQVQAIASDQPNILCWKLTPDGLCTSKSAYKILAIEKAPIALSTNIPSQVIQILRKVWVDKTMQPRVKTCLAVVAPRFRHC